MSFPAPAFIRKRSPAEHLVAIGSRGRAVGRMAGGWVADLAALNKCITLCDFCAAKFNPKAHGYVARRVVPYLSYVIGDCDGCRTPSTRCTMFLKEEGRE